MPQNGEHRAIKAEKREFLKLQFCIQRQSIILKYIMEISHFGKFLRNPTGSFSNFRFAFTGELLFKKFVVKLF